SAILTPSRLFSTKVENQSFLCGREIVFAAIPTFFVAEDRPIKLSGLVDAEIGGCEIAWVFMWL
ncbi:MAG: hypothetical protein MKZ56_07035, partial [Candidatus Thalassarchaeum sp.]|nr:hypothetical protein [Candidatus Thalassarchaeum sp.]